MDSLRTTPVKSKNRRRVVAETAIGRGTLIWALKLLFTVVTRSAVFKGNAVTPLFFIGTALGNALAPILGVPTSVFAALGVVAVFADTPNTPLACLGRPHPRHYPT